MGALTKGLIAAGALVGGVPLAQTAYETLKDKRHYDHLKDKIHNELIPNMMLAGLAGAGVGGGAGYAAGKLQKGTYNMLPKSESTSQTAKNMILALTGRTGMEDTEPYKSFVKDQSRNGMKALMKAKSRLPEGAPSSDFYQGIFEVDPDKALAFGPGAAFKHASYGDLQFIADKLAVSLGGALLTAGGLAGGGYLLNKHVFQPWQKENRRKLELADTLTPLAVPAAAAAGALLGGGGGYIAGRQAGKKQRNRLAQDLYNATAASHLTASLNRQQTAMMNRFSDGERYE